MLIGRKNVLSSTARTTTAPTKWPRCKPKTDPKIHRRDSLPATRNAQTLLHRRGRLQPGTSRPECLPIHKELSQDFIQTLQERMLQNARAAVVDPKSSAPSRSLRQGQVPQPQLRQRKRYRRRVRKCGSQLRSHKLINPKSAISDAVPVMKRPVHWWLDMWKVSELCESGSRAKENWRNRSGWKVLGAVLPPSDSMRFTNRNIKEIKATLPKHKPRYAPGKKIALAVESKTTGPRRGGTQKIGSARARGTNGAPLDHRATVAWGIPLPRILTQK